MGIGPCGPIPLPPLEWTSFLPLVAAVLITPQGAELPDSGRIGVIGAVFFFLSEAVEVRGCGGRRCRAPTGSDQIYADKERGGPES